MIESTVRGKGVAISSNVFVLGLDQHNLEILRRLPGASDIAFHRLLPMDELRGQEIDVRGLLDRAEEQLEDFDGEIDAIVSFWDFPMVTMVPILCSRRGLPSADLLAVLRCEHKYWARHVQSAVITELPAYGLLDLDLPRPVLPQGVRYPVWIKPVNGASSEGAFRVADDAQLRERLPQVWEVVERLGRPFQDVLDLAEVPPEIARIGGMGVLVEEAVTGQQMTLEGFSDDGEVVVYGVVDSVNYPGSSSFLRYQYPSSAPAAVQERMSDIARRVIEATGLRRSTFNVEFFWDPATGDLNLLEVNARHSQSHAVMFEMVDGVSNHQAMLDLAFGRTPPPTASRRPLRHSGKMVPAALPGRGGQVRAHARAGRGPAEGPARHRYRDRRRAGRAALPASRRGCLLERAGHRVHRRPRREGDHGRLPPLRTDPAFRDRRGEDLMRTVSTFPHEVEARGASELHLRGASPGPSLSNRGSQLSEPRLLNDRRVRMRVRARGGCEAAAGAAG